MKNDEDLFFKKTLMVQLRKKKEPPGVFTNWNEIKVEETTM